MFLGQVMKEARKRKGLSQVKLAEGICDQNIISLLERKNSTPKISNLVALLQRLDLSLNDVFSEFSSDSTSEIKNELISLERRLLLGNTEVKNISEELDVLNLNEVTDDIMIQYEYVLSLVKLQMADRNGADFQLDKVLMKTQSDIYNVYTLLAYLNKALIQFEMDRLDEAAYFINTIRGAIKESFAISNASDLQTIYLCLKLAQYFVNIKDKKLANQYATKGLELDQVNQRAYFLGDFYLIKADVSRNTADYEQNQALAKLFENFMEGKKVKLKV